MRLVPLAEVDSAVGGTGRVTEGGDEEAIMPLGRVQTLASRAASSAADHSTPSSRRREAAGSCLRTGGGACATGAGPSRCGAGTTKRRVTLNGSSSTTSSDPDPEAESAFLRAPAGFEWASQGPHPLMEPKLERIRGATDSRRGTADRGRSGRAPWVAAAAAGPCPELGGANGIGGSDGTACTWFKHGRDVSR